MRICGKGFDASSASEGIEDDAFGNAHDWLRLKVFHVFAGVQLTTLIMPRSASTDNGFASLPRGGPSHGSSDKECYGKYNLPLTLMKAYGRIIHLSDM
ncbi:hypothetical protein LNO55_27460 [Klebsiella pneumoniae subsp. pneumoniae]|nr:hypothetical protein [Klebsiella pneumoniae subsp. pneumoniae]